MRVSVILPAEETLAAYRLMGLDLDATYDEIERAFDDLSASYAGDPKRKIKLAVAKDKILEDRLRQRMSGSLQGFTGVKDPYDIPEGPKPFFKIPPRLQGVMELPDKNLLIKNVIVFGLIGILPAAAAEWAATSIAIGFGVSFYLLYNRGVESSEMEAEMRPPKTKPLLMAAGISLLSGMLGGTILVGILGKILSFISPELLIGLGTAAGYCFAATLFKVPDTLR